MLSPMSRLALNVGFIALATGAGTPSLAQQAPAPGGVASDVEATSPQDIVVTAQKRSENVQKVPLAITVVPAAQLQRQQINTLVDLRRTAPSLEFVPPGQSPGSGGFIRGLGTTLTVGSAEPSVGVVVDGVPQGNVPISNIFDIARVEVLRGPQGTLFGQSVSAGLINITSAAPEFGSFSGYAQTELGGDGVAGGKVDRYIGRLVVNAPLADNAAVRIAGHFDNIGNVTHNNLTNKDSNVDDWGIRGRLLWEPSDALTINLIGDYDKNYSHDAPFFSVYRADNPAFQQVLANCGITTGAGNNRTCSPVPSSSFLQNYGGSLQADLRLGDHTLTSISAYRETDQHQISTIDGLPDTNFMQPFPNLLFGPSPKEQRLYSQELRLSSPSGNRLEYVVGGYFSRQTQDYHNLGSTILFFLPFPIPTDIIQRSLNQSIAAFGQATFRLTDTIRAIGGIRYTNNKVRASNVDNTTTPVTSVSNGSTKNNVSWKVGGQWDVRSNFLAYATVARGFKGQTYDDTTNYDAVPLYLKPEIPTSVEVGLKGQLLDHKLNFDVNLYHTRVKDYQAQLCTPDAIRGIVCVPQNIGHVVSKGVELDFFGQPLPGLSINGGLLYADARFPKGYRGTDGSDLGGKQLILSSRFKLNLSGEYEQRLSDTTKGFVSLDGVFRTRVRFVAAGDDGVTYQPHWITGGRIGARFANGKYEVAVFSRNIFNVHEPVLRYLSPLGAAAATATTPAYSTITQILSDSSYRTVGISANVKF